MAAAARRPQQRKRNQSPVKAITASTVLQNNTTLLWSIGSEVVNIVGRRYAAGAGGVVSCFCRRFASQATLLKHASATLPLPQAFQVGDYSQPTWA
jgi:hypothetical protein